MWAMAWWTLSGADSRRSERRTCRRPSRSRMVVLREVKRRKRMSSGGMGARGRSSRYCSSKTAMRDVGAADLDFAVRGYLGWRGLGRVAGEGGKSWEGKRDGVADEEKSCMNWRRGEGPECFGGLRACPYLFISRC